MVAVQALEKHTAELKQKEAQIAVLVSKVEEITAKYAYLETFPARLEGVTIPQNVLVRTTELSSNHTSTDIDRVHLSGISVPCGNKLCRIVEPFRPSRIPALGAFFCGDLTIPTFGSSPWIVWEIFTSRLIEERLPLLPINGRLHLQRSWHWHCSIWPTVYGKWILIRCNY